MIDILIIGIIHLFVFYRITLKQIDVAEKHQEIKNCLESLMKEKEHKSSTRSRF